MADKKVRLKDGNDILYPQIRQEDVVNLPITLSSKLYNDKNADTTYIERNGAEDQLHILKRTSLANGLGFTVSTKEGKWKEYRLPNTESGGTLSTNTVNGFDPDNFQDGTKWLNHQPGENEVGNANRPLILFGTEFKTNNGDTIATTPYVDNAVKNLYPVGSIYMSFSNTSPASFIGGSWSQMSNTFLYASTSDVIASNGSRYGEEKHTLTTNEMPSHNHNIGDWYLVQRQIGTNSSSVFYGSGNSKVSGNTGLEGGGQAHNNMPPYTKVYMWRRTA